MKLISNTLLHRAGLFALAFTVSTMSWGQVDRSKPLKRALLLN